MYVHAVGLRDRLIGAVGNILILLVNQTDVAKHIAIEGENSRVAVRHSVVEPPHCTPEPIRVQDHL